MKNLTIKTALLLFNAIFFVFVSQAQNIIDGNIQNPNTKEYLPFINVSLEKDGVTKYTATTDEDGYFFIKNINNDVYDIKLISFAADAIINNINVFNEDLNLQLDFDDSNYMDTVVIIGIRDLVTQGDIKKIDSEILKTQKPRVITDVLNQIPTAVETSEGISFKGARPGTAVYYIDGIRTYGDLYVPMGAVKSIEVYTGGVPAQYGNSTSGVIVVETKSYEDYL